VAASTVGSKVVRGSVWLIITGIVSRALGIVGTLYLTRLVAPAAYGEVSDAFVVAFTMHVIANVGVGIWAIAHPQATPEERFHAALIHTVLGALLVVPLPLFGGPIGRALSAPTMGPYLPGMVVAVMCERIGLLPERLLIGNMRFATISLQRAGAEILYTIVSVGGAVLGLGAMAIVAGNVARSASKLLMLLVVVKWREWLLPCRLRLETFKRIVSFGIPISLGQLVGFGLRRWDNLIVSYLHGAEAVGAYNLAYNLADIPAVQIGEQITDALQVSYAGENVTDPQARLLRSVAVLAFIMTPMAVGLGAVAPTLAGLFLNQRWAGVGPMLVWLSVISFPRPLSGAVSSYMQVRNRRRAFLAIELFTLVTLVASLFTLGRLGPLHACAAVGATFVLRLIAAGVVLWRLDGVPLGAFFRPQVPPVVASLIMAAAVTATRIALERVGVPGILTLAVELPVGMAAYAGAARIVAPATWEETVGMVRKALARRRRPPAPAPVVS
jgi:lipopolysaccharide exporter